MKNHIILFSLLFTNVIFSQSVLIDFEDISLSDESFLNGSDGSGGFLINDIFLHNTYNPAYGGFWSGWAISNTTDVSNPSFTNQYSAIAGSGYNGSNNYAVSYAPINSSIILKENLSGRLVSGMYVTNGTYPYLSMLNGDGIAKRFGGPDGNDPDFFKLTVKKYLDGEIGIDSVEFYLADYRFDDNNKDYIVNTWEYLDLSSLGMVDSLEFSLSSSDTGQFGMNTPAYFYIDNVLVQIPLATSDLTDINEYSITPNPNSGTFSIQSNYISDLQYELLDSHGKLIQKGNYNENMKVIDMHNFPNGYYFLRIQNKDSITVKKLIKTKQ